MTHPLNNWERSVCDSINQTVPDGFGWMLVVAPMGKPGGDPVRFTMLCNCETSYVPGTLREVADSLDRRPGT